MCEYERAVNGVHSQNDTDSDEGAKVFKLLKTASEPELLMAEMSLEQLTSFTTYKSKFEVEYCLSFLTRSLSAKLIKSFRFLNLRQQNKNRWKIQWQKLWKTLA